MSPHLLATEGREDAAGVVVVGLVVLHARALLQHVAVGDGGEVAEDVLAAALGGDEA